MRDITSIDVILNRGSGVNDKEDARQSLQQLFADNGIEARISIAHSGEEIDKLAREAARGDSQVIVAGGGDGTINTVAAAILDSGRDKKLGVLPLGTLNHLAQDLGLPLELAEAAQVIIAGHSVNIDVGEVNGRIFLNNSSLGLYPIIVRERMRQERLGHGKWPAFIWASLSVFRRYPFLAVRLLVAGKELNCRAPFVFVGNNIYAMEGLEIGSRTRLDEGRLSLYMTNRTGRWGLVRLALRAFLGRLRSEKDFIALATGAVTIETRHKRLRVAFDGEVAVMETPLHYRTLPGVLRVIVRAGEDN